MNANAPRIGLAVSLVAALCACASTPKQVANPPPALLTPLKQYVLQASTTPQQIALGVHAEGLSLTQQAALTDFYGRWRDNGAGDVTVKVPASSGDEQVARRMADITILFLRKLGVPAERLRLGAYDAHPSVRAPVIVDFEAFKAIVADCSTGWSNLVATKDNNPQTHFGCAETANIAAMIANPRDIVTPTPTDPSDGARREVVMDKYRQGLATSTAADNQASGAVSSK